MLEPILHQGRTGPAMLGFAPRTATDERAGSSPVALLTVGAGVNAITFEPVRISLGAKNSHCFGEQAYLRYLQAVHENWTRVLFFGAGPASPPSGS
ncbi:hypothetical protein N7532_009624 [Penicillium argentinense]|uniref:Uncharacterized protein n=1 Tax=Penicillium argentinense TaxID=1131581 RepID=A0A9W9EZV7_9EURO|nr:uncharacterized protein N7532_009624 [Penicillium argentinense]KAJ5090940.1 hypothetical protein N7532_009624 [Penicillium argentinense]